METFFRKRNYSNRQKIKIENESEKNTFRHKIYNLKSDNNYAKFSEFIILLREKLT